MANKTKIYIVGHNINPAALLNELEGAGYVIAPKQLDFKAFVKSPFNVAFRDELALFSTILSPELQQQKAKEFIASEVIILHIYNSLNNPCIKQVKLWGIAIDVEINYNLLLIDPAEAVIKIKKALKK